MIVIQSEDDAQRALCEWLDLHGIVHNHVPNGGVRSKKEAAIMAGLGVKPGFPDILIFTPPPHYPAVRGVAIELKKRLLSGPQPKPRPEQLAWLNTLGDLGWIAFAAAGSNEAIDVLEAMGFGQGGGDV